MARSLPLECPSCRGPLVVTRLACPRCRLTLEGEFEAGCRYCRLSAEHQALFDAFLMSRGVLTEMEKALGISYPTLRGRLDGLFEALGVATQDRTVREDARRERLAVLHALEQGDLAVDDAVKRLHSLRF